MSIDIQYIKDNNIHILKIKTGTEIFKPVLANNKNMVCINALNLDGGSSSQLIYNNKLINIPDSPIRPVSDCIGVYER